MFDDMDNWFVGTGGDFESVVMTEVSLRENMEAVVAIAGEEGAVADWRDPGKLSAMHTVRNSMFGLENPDLRLRYCGEWGRAGRLRRVKS